MLLQGEVLTKPLLVSTSKRKNLEPHALEFQTRMFLSFLLKSINIYCGGVGWGGVGKKKSTTLLHGPWKRKACRHQDCHW